MKSITLKQLLSVTQIPSRHVYLQYESALGLNPPRKTVGGQEIREFPEGFVNQLAALNAILIDLDIPLGEFLQIEQNMNWAIPRGEFGCRDILADGWDKYIKSFIQSLREATVDVIEFKRWEWELDLYYPINRQGRVYLDRDWIRYLQTVQEKYADGKDRYWVYYNIKRPNEVRPSSQFSTVES